MSLSGKVAIVSGAAQGLGRAFAVRLAKEGCRVLGFDVKKEVLDVTGITGMVADVSKRDDVAHIITF